MQGTVTAFDVEKGYGTVENRHGRPFFFHCTQIADGSRSVDVGAAVTFEVVAGHLGRYEAVAVDASGAASRRASS